MLLKQCEHSLFTPPLPPVAFLSLHPLRTWVFWRVGPWWGPSVCRWNSVALDRWTSLLHLWEIRAVKAHSSPLLAAFPASSTCLAHLYTHSLFCFPTHIARGLLCLKTAWIWDYRFLRNSVRGDHFCLLCFVFYRGGHYEQNFVLFCLFVVFWNGLMYPRLALKITCNCHAAFMRCWGWNPAGTMNMLSKHVSDWVYILSPIRTS